MRPNDRCAILGVCAQTRIEQRLAATVSVFWVADQLRLRNKVAMRVRTVCGT